MDPITITLSNATGNATTLFAQIGQGVSIAGIDYIPGIIIALLSMFIITRDFARWKTLFFPLYAGTMLLGMNGSYIVLTIGALIFVIDAFSVQTLGVMVSGIRSVTEGTAQWAGKRYTARQSSQSARAQLQNKLDAHAHFINLKKEGAFDYQPDPDELKALKSRKNRKLKSFIEAEQKVQE